MHAIHWLVTDFDRTLVRLFSDDALRALCSALEAAYGEWGVGQDHLGQMRDPFALWAQTYRCLLSHFGPLEAKAVHDATSAILTRAELRAAAQAELLPGVADTLRWMRDVGLGCAIVSSNSAQAVRLVLERTRVASLVAHVVGRDSDVEMEHLKPSPELIERAIKTLDAKPEHTAFVGDSRDDMAAGKAAGVFVIGVLSGRTGREELLQSGADVVLTRFLSLQSLGLVFCSAQKPM